MDIHEFDDLTEDGDEVTAHRARASTELDQIARRQSKFSLSRRLTSTSSSSYRIPGTPFSSMAPCPMSMT